MEKNKVEVKVQDNKVIYKRYFDAPIELAFEAWSTHEHLSQWWGPDGFTLTTLSMNFTNGGIWDFIMHGPDGTDYKNKIQFIEIKQPHLLLYKHIGDGDSKDTDDVHFKTKITFEESADGTIVTMEQIFPTKEELQRVDKEFGAIEGGKQHIGNLAKYLDKIK